MEPCDALDDLAANEQWIESIVILLEPRDEVERIIIRAAVVAALDVLHETGDPETMRVFVVGVIQETFEQRCQRALTARPPR